MNCVRCLAQNDQGSRYCKNCGSDMPAAITFNNKTNNSYQGDAMLIVFVALTVILNILQFVLPQVLVMYEKPGKYIQVGLWIVHNMAFILIPLAIKDNVIKIVGLVLTSLLIIYWLVNNFQYLMN